MTRKPEIQYVGQFYVYGSEARALELEEKKKQPKNPLPIAGEEKKREIYVDPVALVAIAVSVFMLVTMVMGMLQLRGDWMEYRQINERVETLRVRNHQKTEAYREMFDLRQIQEKAQSMGMIPKAEAEQLSVTITIPAPEPKVTLLDEVRWFLSGLFA